jgi:ABC-2 type transport system permease protein
VLSSVVHIILVSLIITVTAGPLFKAGIPVHWGYFALILLLSAFNLASLGMLIGVVSPDTRSIVLFSQSIFLPSMILGGLMIPSDMLPPALYRISLLLPISYAMNAWRGLAFGMTTTFEPRWAVLALLGSALIAFILAIYLFNWDSKNKQPGRRSLLGLLALLPFILGTLFLAN